MLIIFKKAIIGRLNRQADESVGPYSILCDPNITKCCWASVVYWLRSWTGNRRVASSPNRYTKNMGGGSSCAALSSVLVHGGGSLEQGT